MGSPALKSEKIRALLSENLQALMDELDISENELARRSGVSQKQVNNIVNERTGCGTDALDAIARVAGVAAWTLLVPGYGHIENHPRFTRAVEKFASIRSDAQKAIEVILGL